MRIIILILFVLLFSCSPEETIKIGFIGSLSGRQAQMGISGRNGLLLAIDDFNASGGLQGRKAVIVTRDNKGNTLENIREVNALLDHEGVRLIVGPFTSNMAEGTLEVIKERKVLVFSPIISKDDIKGLDDNFLRIGLFTSHQAEKAAEWIFARGYKRIGIIYDTVNLDYSLPLYERFRIIMALRENEIVFTGHYTSETSSLEISQSLLENEPDVLFLILSGIDAAGICQQLRKLGSSIPVVGPTWAKTNNLIIHGGRSVEGMILVSSFERRTKSEVYNHFLADYRRHFFVDPDFVAAGAYDVGTLLFTRIRETRSLDPAVLKAAIVGRKFSGLEEDITIDAYGDCQRQICFFLVKEGQFIRLEDDGSFPQ